MRKLLGIGAVILGVVGVMLCAAGVGLGWWVAMRTTAHLDRVATRVDQGMSVLDVQLGRVEARLNAVRTELKGVGEAAESIAAENPELPRVQAEIERLLNRMILDFDRADAIADSLRSVAAGLQTATDIVDQFNDDPQATVRVRSAADRIDSAAESLNGLRSRVEALKTVKAAQLTRELVTLAREAAASSEQLAEGLGDARQGISVVRERTAEWRNKLVAHVFFAAATSTLIWLWCGLGQLCLIGWGRRYGRPLRMTQQQSSCESR